MIEISKNEAMDMRKLLGNDQVKHSHSKHPKYYLVGSENNIEKYTAYCGERIKYTKF